MKTLLATATAAVAMIAAMPATATTTVYTDQAAFDVAAGTTAVEDFGDTMLVSGLTYSSTVGTIGSGVFNDRLVIGAQTTTFNFADGTTSFGANFDLTPGGQGLGIKFLLSLASGGTEMVSAEVPQAFSGQFFGFTSSSAFTSVTLQGGTQSGVAETYNLDNLRFGVSAAGGVPEPATWALMILGFGAVGGAMRRRSGQGVAVAA
ncbi:hypothetical protein ASG29_09010 [Sphingomonas sp. Leaf412]|uniref:PEPxxWA-CTERM sorting domain-containing protein n=1 Tax=Sphingomonas sp. Leaf412 TaxID=1736370 RepID=UPI0006FCE8CD|nr:PEPxxWA-CTERM sorting domain-containing protein [Sphingomonas sp. Leaf412]KQT31992.1 hypothetical protein ASG29_09010 [Sphingomonas sp. Leaf412]